MKTLPPCLLYSCDAALADRIGRLASPVAAPQLITEPVALEQWIARFGDAVLIADLRTPGCFDLLADIKQNRPALTIIALEEEVSPEAGRIDFFAVCPLSPKPREFLPLLEQAIEHRDLRRKNQILEEEISRLQAQSGQVLSEAPTAASMPLQNLSKTHRDTDNLNTLFDSIVEETSATARVSRAGLFIRPDQGVEYIFQSGIRCLAATEKMKINPHDPFIPWLEMNAHLVSRSTLSNISDPQERAMLKQILDALGAEIIIPLHINGGIRGWLFTGRRSTGIPFDLADLEELADLGNHISITLEKAYHHEETALQKALAETVLHTIPFGIVACDENAIIRWINRAAQEFLEPVGDGIGQRVEALGDCVSGLLHDAIDNRQAHGYRDWCDAQTKLTLSAETRCLTDGENCVGAMMMIHDITGEKLLQEKEELLNRTAFWNDLATSMSHEIRNPLVAIKAFSQLLPERYNDPDFREEFNNLVNAEVKQIEYIINKINAFANPGETVFQPLDIREPIEHAVARIQSELDHSNLKIHLSADESALQIKGDTDSLRECIYHLLMNAAENLADRPGARISITIKGRPLEIDDSNIYILISDNGSGIDEELQNKTYSPFSTTKAGGLGFGLPIAKRAMIEHNGEIDINTGSTGTTVSLSFPALEPDAGAS